MLRMGRSNRPEESDQAARQAQAGQQATTPGATSGAQPTPAGSPPAYPAPTPPRAVSETDALARDLKDGLIGGFVGVHSSVTGEANFKGMLRVDGRISGRINSQDGTLIVSAGGQVDADIAVAVAKINGTVVGDIKASTRIEFGRTARVTGNVQTPALVIEQGAIFEGSCRMNSLAAQQTKTQATTNQAPARNAAATPAAKENKPQPAHSESKNEGASVKDENLVTQPA